MIPALSLPCRHVPADHEAGSDPSSAGPPAMASLSASGQYWVVAIGAGRGEKTANEEHAMIAHRSLSDIFLSIT